MVLIIAASGMMKILFPKASQKNSKRKFKIKNQGYNNPATFNNELSTGVDRMIKSGNICTIVTSIVISNIIPFTTDDNGFLRFCLLFLKLKDCFRFNKFCESIVCSV